jgi:Icc-related predicted phosphoesterase
MTLAFDLISDLHVETWDQFDWTDQPTSPYCIVAGDVARDRGILMDTLKHLDERYSAVFYIDGNDEHRHYLETLGESYAELHEEINKFKNVVFMQDNVVIVNNVAILATNGWWTYDFENDDTYDHAMDCYMNHVSCSVGAATAVTSMAYQDYAYIANSIQKLQTHKEVDTIVLVTHTLPAAWLVKHDTEMIGTWRYNCLGNQYMQSVLDKDTENKIKIWCFGHYHRSVDRIHNGIRYISNPRGRGDTPWSQPIYYPKRIEIEM